MDGIDDADRGIEAIEKTFARELCPSCPGNKLQAVFKIADSRICLQCYQVVKKASGKDSDGIHAMTLAIVKGYMAEKVEKVIDIKPESDIVEE